jgi:hypothetical protein
MLNRLQAVFASFHSRDVKYLVLGGIAAVLYGVPRATFDLDVLIETSPDNARRLLAALVDAGMGTAAMVTPEELLANEITVFNGRVRLDVQTSSPGLAFDSAWSRRAEMNYQGQVFYVVSREDLIASKRAAGRPVDLEDARILEMGA